jgi:REP-associated tyrosine transposase
MSRPLRVDVGGYVYHTLNRASTRAILFEGPDDYQRFEQVLHEAQARTGMRILAYCLMPNHWHLVLWPGADGTLSRFMTWLTLTHTQRWHAGRGSAGVGHLYQGRYKSFLVQADQHLLTVCRYVERNPRRAGLVRRAEAWRWGSLWRRERGRGLDLLSDWPLARPRKRCQPEKKVPEKKVSEKKVSGTFSTVWTVPGARGSSFAAVAWWRLVRSNTVRPCGQRRRPRSGRRRSRTSTTSASCSTRRTRPMPLGDGLLGDHLGDRGQPISTVRLRYTARCIKPWWIKRRKRIAPSVHHDALSGADL